MRILLSVVKGPRSFEDIITFNGEICETFKEACIARRLLEEDDEWHMAIEEASKFASGAEVRKLFVTLLLYCHVTEPEKLWEKNFEYLCERIEYHHTRLYQYQHIRLPTEQIKNLALQEIEMLMKKNGRSLRELAFQKIPYPDMSNMDDIGNPLIMQEMDYDKLKLQEEFDRLRKGLNPEQEDIYEIINSVDKEDGGLFFVYGSGGTGKTYLWNTIISSLHARLHVQVWSS